MIVRSTSSFDRQFAALEHSLQDKVRETIGFFLDYYASRQFPKSLRVHKCGRFLSLSVSMNYRVFVVSIPAGVRFVFVGDHHDAETYLKK